MSTYLVTWNDDEKNFTHFEYIDINQYRCTDGGWKGSLIENRDGSCHMEVSFDWERIRYDNYKFTDCESYEEYKERFCYE